MVYIHSWQEYQDAAEALYRKSPKIVGITVHLFVIATLTASVRLDTV